jgi:hypothetical protein
VRWRGTGLLRLFPVVRDRGAAVRRSRLSRVPAADGAAKREPDPGRSRHTLTWLLVIHN